MTARTYGAQPLVLSENLEIPFVEFLHYQYLPVVMPGNHGVRLPERLEFLREAIDLACDAAGVRPGALFNDRYVYVTAKHRFATPGNPINRPGWHADGFGSNDINVIWSSAFPTRFATGAFSDISADHLVSLEQFELQTRFGVESDVKVWSGTAKRLYLLDSFVVHSPPTIQVGGMRAFLKVSVSESRYNLRGNSHNYLFDYDWKMWSRDEIRNDPAYAGGDAGPQS